MSSNYVSFKIPKELAEAIDDYMEENKHLGYKTRAEFVKEAIRQKLERE